MVAVGFIDGASVAIGSHAGFGIVDVVTGEVRDRVPDAKGEYSWYQADPPSVRIATPAGITLVPACGLWGGELRRESSDSWSASLVAGGASLSHPDGLEFVIDDDDDVRALGFSPKAETFVFATSSTFHAYWR